MTQQVTQERCVNFAGALQTAGTAIAVQHLYVHDHQ